MHAVVVAVLAIFGLMAQAPSAPQPGQSQSQPSAKPGQQSGEPATDLPFILDAAVTPNQAEVVLQLDSNGLASLGIIRRIDDGQTTFALVASDFVDAQGQPSAASLMVDNRPESDVLENLTAPTGALRVQLRIAPSRPLTRLSGTLTLTTAARSVTWRVHVQPVAQHPATLVVDRQSETLHFPHCRFLCDERPAGDAPPQPDGSASPEQTVTRREFSVRVFDKSRTWPLEGVFVRIDQVAKPGQGFSLARDVSFTLNNRRVDLLSPADLSARNVPAGSVGLVRGTFRNLPPGEYSVTLRFGASNSVDDDAQKMALSVFVKDGPWLPLLVLLAAVLASFLATKFVSARREGLALKSRIATLDASWLRNEPPTSAVVWAQANLRLAKAALGSSWAKIPEMVSERIQDVEGLLPTLRRIRDLRKAIQLASPERFITRRAGLRLGRLLAQCSDPPISPGLATTIDADLTGLEPWLKPDEVLKTYWMDVREAVDRFVARVKLRTPEIADARAREVVDGLVRSQEAQLAKNAKDAQAPPADAVEIEQQYAALQLLWRNRHRDHLFTQLIERQKTGVDIEAVFKTVDSDVWNRIKSAAGDPNALSIRRPSADPQAFEPFTLSVTTADRELDDSYLFREGLRYVWSIRLEQEYAFDPFGFLKWIRSRGELTPTSLEPSITQYSRYRGSAIAGVTLWNGADWCSPQNTVAVPIRKSAAFRVARSFEITEVVPLVLAFVVAVVTGMSTMYASNATFGSLGDYLGLFLWGAAVDQGKNALQGGLGVRQPDQSATTSATKPAQQTGGSSSAAAKPDTEAEKP